MHWYDSQAKLVTSVPRADGKGEREPTLRDARKLDLRPSVTTILTIIARFGLVDWQIEQAIKAALSHPSPLAALTEEFDKARIRQIKDEAREYTNWAASFGTEVHQAISAEHAGGTAFLGHVGAREIVDGFWLWQKHSLLRITESERAFVCNGGWAGTVDILGTYDSKPILVDLKTREGHEVYEADALQLAGYALGLGFEGQRASVTISRETPGDIEVRLWDENDRWDQAWLHTWGLWKQLKRWEG